MLHYIENLHDIGFGSDFLDMTPKAQAKKENRQIGFHENFYILHIKKVKRQPTEWKKISAAHISDNGIITRIYRKLLKFNNKKNPKQPN